LIPIADEIRSRRVPWVTWLLLLANVVVFFYQTSMGDAAMLAFVMRWGAVPVRVIHPVAYPWSLLTLFTSIFLHGGWLHLFSNMLYLWIFGDNVEDVLGHGGFLLFYVMAGVLAGLAQVLSMPWATVPAIGASGAIAGVLAVYLVFFPTAPVRVLVPGLMFMHVTRLPAALVLLMWFLLQLFNGFLSLGVQTMATGGVAWFAHIGGFVVGLIVGAIARARHRRRTVWDWDRYRRSGW